MRTPLAPAPGWTRPAAPRSARWWQSRRPARLPARPALASPERRTPVGAPRGSTRHCAAQARLGGNTMQAGPARLYMSWAVPGSHPAHGCFTAVRRWRRRPCTALAARPVACCLHIPVQSCSGFVTPVGTSHRAACTPQPRHGVFAPSAERRALVRTGRMRSCGGAQCSSRQWQAVSVWWECADGRCAAAHWRLGRAQVELGGARGQPERHTRACSCVDGRRRRCG